MISWIQTSFQKHIKLVFALLLIAVIVPFIFTIGRMPGLGQANRNTKTIELFGVPFTSDAERQAFYADGQVSFYLNTGQPYYDPTQVQMHSFQRGAAIELADKLGIPDPSPAQITEFIKTLPAFFGKDGQFDQASYTNFRDNIASNPQASASEISRVLTQDWRILQVNKVLGGPGYVLKGEVEQALARADTVWSVETATVDLATLPKPATPTEDELHAWFDANAPRYRIPERVKVEYVAFPASDYVSRVSLTDDEIVKYFDQNKARYKPPAPKVAEGETPPPPAEVTLADVRDRVVGDLTQKRASNLAAKAAADFAYVLFDKQIAPGTDAFSKLIAGDKLDLQSPPAFTASEIPPGLNWNQTIVTEAFGLSEKHPVSDPVSSGGKTFLLFFQEKIPPTDADFFAVRDRVVADVEENKRREAVTKMGEELQKQLQAAVKGGQSFADAAKAAGLETKGWNDFSLRNRPQDLDYNVASRLEDLPVREVSPMAVQGDKGILAFVAKREVPDLAATDAAFSEARESLMRQSSQMTQQGLITSIVDKELKASGLTNETS